MGLPRSKIFEQMYAHTRKCQRSGEIHEYSNSNNGEGFLKTLEVDRIVA